ncbi:hypothetical protein B0T19DRAFT_452004 [Cercophora scortea]|uniref:Uncharacterized protein n=1 Tax=Cercophora scortea TaxID=314031 RepID=A0AAE0J2S0_9PEZI|nr:hypothetical protein B0T19DRAFT_452004 [Cercophora scortea]
MDSHGNTFFKPDPVKIKMEYGSRIKSEYDSHFNMASIPMAPASTAAKKLEDHDCKLGRFDNYPLTQNEDFKNARASRRRFRSNAIVVRTAHGIRIRAHYDKKRSMLDFTINTGNEIPAGDAWTIDAEAEIFRRLHRAGFMIELVDSHPGFIADAFFNIDTSMQPILPSLGSLKAEDDGKIGYVGDEKKGGLSKSFEFKTSVKVRQLPVTSRPLYKNEYIKKLAED